MEQVEFENRGRSHGAQLNRAVYWLSRHWLLVFIGVWGAFNLLPWLAPGFYAGDALGSFNSWMRLVSGLLFSLGGVWFVLPQLERSFSATSQTIEEKFERAGVSP